MVFPVSRSISSSMQFPGFGGGSPAGALPESGNQHRNQQRISERRCHLTKTRSATARGSEAGFN